MRRRSARHDVAAAIASQSAHVRPARRRAVRAAAPPSRLTARVELTAGGRGSPRAGVRPRSGARSASVRPSTPRGTPRPGRPGPAACRRRAPPSARSGGGREPARSRERVRVGVQVGGAERTRHEAGLEGGLVHPPAAEEAGALDDVERAELGRDARGRRAARPSGRPGSSRRPRRPSRPRAASRRADRLDQLEDVVALERRDRRRSRAGLRRRRGTAPAGRVPRLRRRACGRRTSGSRRPSARRRSGCSSAWSRNPAAGPRTPRRAPSATRPRRRGARRADTERPKGPGRAVDDAEHGRHVEERRSGRRPSTPSPDGAKYRRSSRTISSSPLQSRSGSESRLCQASMKASRSTSSSSPVSDRLLEGRRAGEPAARGMADAPPRRAPAAATACRRAVRAGRPRSPVRAARSRRPS